MADLSFYSNPDLADGFGSTANGRANAHRGLDFPMAAGTAIPAIRGGTVVINEWSDGLGWCLEVAGDDGRFYGYRHMQSESPLGVGARVEQGGAVGAVGSTGSLAQGSHLCTTNASGEGGVRGIPALVSDPWPYIQSAMNGESVAASTAVQASRSSLSDVLWSGEDWSYCDPHGQVAADIQYNLSRLGFYNRDDGSDRPADGDFGDFSRMGVQRVLADSGVFAGDIDGKIWRGGSYGVQQFADAWGSYTARGGVIDGAPRLLSWTCFSDGLGAYVASKQTPAAPAVAEPAPVPVEPSPVEPTIVPEQTTSVSETATPVEASGTSGAPVATEEQPAGGGASDATSSTVRTPEPIKVYRPITQEGIMTIQDTIPKIDVDPNALGAIVTDAATRKRIYTVWTLFGLALAMIGAGGFAAAVTAIAAIAMGWSPWLVVPVSVFSGLAGVYGIGSQQVSNLAAANTNAVKR